MSVNSRSGPVLTVFARSAAHIYVFPERHQQCSAAVVNIPYCFLCTFSNLSYISSSDLQETFSTK